MSISDEATVHLRNEFQDLILEPYRSTHRVYSRRTGDIIMSTGNDLSVMLFIFEWR